MHLLIVVVFVAVVIAEYYLYYGIILMYFKLFIYNIVCNKNTNKHTLHCIHRYSLPCTSKETTTKKRIKVRDNTDRSNRTEEQWASRNRDYQKCHTVLFCTVGFFVFAQWAQGNAVCGVL